MWRYEYNSEANDYYYTWFDIVDRKGKVIAMTPCRGDTNSDDETCAILITSLSHYYSVLRYLKRSYSTAFIEWLERHPCDWLYVTMVINEYISCRNCDKTIGSIDFGNLDVVAALELCRGLAMCEDCRNGENNVQPQN